jgi:hypothetical protein
VSDNTIPLQVTSVLIYWLKWHVAELSPSDRAEALAGIETVLGHVGSHCGAEFATGRPSVAPYASDPLLRRTLDCCLVELRRSACSRLANILEECNCHCETEPAMSSSEARRLSFLSSLATVTRVSALVLVVAVAFSKLSLLVYVYSS